MTKTSTLLHKLNLPEDLKVSIKTEKQRPSLTGQHVFNFKRSESAYKIHRNDVNLIRYSIYEALNLE